MTRRENLLALLKKESYGEIPVDFFLCPHLMDTYSERTGSAEDYMDYFGIPWRRVEPLIPFERSTDKFKKYHADPLIPGTEIDMWGVAHEPGSEAAMHMTRLRYPLVGIDSVEALREYPFPSFKGVSNERQRRDADLLKKNGLVSIGNMQMTIWETAWSIRSMEDLMVDMMTEDPMAEYLLDRVAGVAEEMASLYADAGVDVLFLGDDIGMQHSAMMSEELYVTWLKPRLARVIAAARAVNPGIIVAYHSCGKIDGFIPHLIDAGVDVLDPIQPECMDFERIYGQYADSLVFHGTIGTQSTMPFGTPEEVKRETWKNLDISKGGRGLFVAPTHLLEPEVPWENIIAYVEACREYGGG